MSNVRASLLASILAATGSAQITISDEKITPEILNEYGLIKQKKSRLSKSKRDAIVRVVEGYING